MLDKIDLSKKLTKRVYKTIMPELSNRLYNAQKTSWDAGIPVVIIFEGWDAAGKGTSIQRLTRPLDPRGFKLYPIRAARTHEKKHPWLWRFWQKIPAYGEMAITGEHKPSLNEVALHHDLPRILNDLPSNKTVRWYESSLVHQAHPDWYRKDLTTLVDLLAQEKIEPVIAERFSLEESVRAHELLEASAVCGKIILVCNA